MDPHASATPSRWVQRWAPLIRPGGTVLDVACGSARHVHWLSQRGLRVTGVDRDGAALAGLRGTPGVEQLVEADVTEWARIKSSKKIDDWVRYLRSFPNGRFAEIAQVRLARLLGEDEKLAAEKRQREEEQRLEQERIAEQQRLATERRQLEEHQLKEARRREEGQKRLSENQRLERERKSIAAAAQLAASQTPSPATATSSAAGPRPAPSAKPIQFRIPYYQPWARS